MEPTNEAARPKQSTGWKIAGIVLAVLAVLFTLVALSGTSGNTGAETDAGRQVGLVIGRFILPVLTGLGAWYCFRRAGRAT